MKCKSKGYFVSVNKLLMFLYGKPLPINNKDRNQKKIAARPIKKVKIYT